MAVQDVSLRTVKRRQFVAETRSYADDQRHSGQHDAGRPDSRRAELIVRIRLLNILLLAAAGACRLPALAVPGRASPGAAGDQRRGDAARACGTEREQDAEVAEPRPEVYDVIVARDLFSPTRGVVPPAPAAAAKPAPKPQPAPKLTLYGVVIIDGEKTAYLQEGTQEARPRKVRENENFAGGVVKAIRPDGVTFLFAGSEINVPLRTPKDGAGAPSPARSGCRRRRPASRGAGGVSAPSAADRCPTGPDARPGPPAGRRPAGDARSGRPCRSTRGVRFSETRSSRRNSCPGRGAGHDGRRGGGMITPCPARTRGFDKPAAVRIKCEPKP